MAGKATARSAAINLLNTIIGAGMLTMPYAVRSDGILLGIFVIVLSAGCSSFGLYLQGKCAKYVEDGESSFFALSQLTYPQLSVVFDLAIAIKCFGVGISYLVVIGDLMPKISQFLFSEEYLVKHAILEERNFWITISMILVVVPLSFLKKLDSLKYASVVALSSVVYLVVLVLTHFLRHDIEDKGPVRVFKPYSATAVFASFPIYVFAYTCHQNMFSLVNELQDKSGKTINRVIAIAIGTAMSLYIVVGLTGYLSFGDNVQPNVIVGYKHAISSTVGRIAIVILVMLSYPLQCHPARASINHTIHYFKTLNKNRSLKFKTHTTHLEDTPRQLIEENTQHTTADNSDESSNLIDYDEADENAEEGMINAVSPLKGYKFIAITSSILLASYLVAISVKSLAHVLAFVGSTGSTSISFILPGIFGYQLIGSEYSNVKELPIKTKLTRYAAFGLSIWGFLVMVICLSATIFLGATH